MDLANADLNGVDLSQANLTGVDFDGASVKDADLEWADLAGDDLSQAGFDGTNFANANLDGANLTGLQLYTDDFEDANLVGAQLADVYFLQPGCGLSPQCPYSPSNLYGVNFTEADLDGAVFVASGGAAELGDNVWSDTTCPDGTNSNSDGGTCTSDGA